jgi:hypothetical protein
MNDLYSRVAARTGVPRGQVKCMCFAACYDSVKRTDEDLEDMCVKIVQAWLATEDQNENRSDTGTTAPVI